MSELKNIKDFEDKLESLIIESVTLTEKRKEIRENLDTVKSQIAIIMEQCGCNYYEGECGSISTIAFDVDRLKKDKVEDLIDRSKDEAINNISYRDVAELGHVAYYKVKNLR